MDVMQMPRQFRPDIYLDLNTNRSLLPLIPCIRCPFPLIYPLDRESSTDIILCSGLLTFLHAKYHFLHTAPQHVNLLSFSQESSNKSCDSLSLT